MQIMSTESFRVYDDGKSVGCIQGGAGMQLDKCLNPLAWNHVVVVATAFNKRQVYVNGVDRGEQDCPVLPTLSTKVVCFMLVMVTQTKMRPLMVTCRMHTLSTASSAAHKPESSSLATSGDR